MSALDERVKVHPQIAADYLDGMFDQSTALLVDAYGKMQRLRTYRDALAKDGEWNNSSYMLGAFNGVEHALAIMEGREPDLRAKPESGFLLRKPQSGSAQ